LQLLDHQFPLKNVRRDKIGKIDLIGVTGRVELTLIELKVAESTENPRIALLEVLGYWAVVHGNFARINDELKNRARGFGRLLIVAPPEYWRRWLEPKRKQRWLRFCLLLHEIEGNFDASVECLSLHDVDRSTQLKRGQAMPRFTLESVEIGMEGFSVAADGTITDADFFDEL
jgi:hypothetical protein